MDIIDNFTQDIAVSKSVGNQKDFDAILSIIQTYSEGGRCGDAQVMTLVHAFDWKCPQHITLATYKEEVEKGLVDLDQKLIEAI